MAMTLAEDVIKDCFKDEKSIDEKSKEISQDIVSKQYEIEKFIEDLGFALTSTDVQARANANLLLSKTLAHLPADYLLESQLHFIAAFYTDRVRDHHSVLPAVLSGIQTLANMRHLPSERIAPMMTALFNNVPCQSQVKVDREKYFSIIKVFSETKIEVIKAMKQDFVYGVINAIDGERDPRILLFLYEFLPSFLREYPLGHLAETMFDVIGCYFPIDFTPSPSDVNIITRDLLAEKLSYCLSGAEDFADPCIELLLEKLDSQLKIAHMDSLHLLILALKRFKLEDLEKHIELIWDNLSGRLLSVTIDKDVLTLVLQAAEQLVKTTSASEIICRNLHGHIFRTTILTISDVNSRLFETIRDLVIVCSNSNRFSASQFADKIIPLLLAQLTIGNIDQTCLLIDFMIKLIVNCKENGCIDDINYETILCVQEECLKALSDPKIEKLFAVGLEGLTKISSKVNIENRQKIYAILKSEINENHTNCLKLALMQYSLAYPKEVKEAIINDYLNQELININISKESLGNIITLIKYTQFEAEIVKFIFKCMFDIENLEIKMISLRCLRTFLEENVDSPEIIISIAFNLYQKYQMIDKLIELTHKIPSLTSDVLIEILHILTIIVRSLDISIQSTLVHSYLPMINLNQSNDLYLVAGLLKNWDSTIDLQNYFQPITTVMTNLCISSTDDILINVCQQLLCILFNKMPDQEYYRNILRVIFDILQREIEQQCVRAVEILAWITKGLFVRGFVDSLKFVDVLIGLLDNSTFSFTAALGFETICSELSQLRLTTLSHFHNQKLFNYLLSKMGDKLMAGSELHLRAFAYVLQVQTSTVLKFNIEKVGYILIKSMYVSDVSTLMIILGIINKFLQTTEEYFKTNLQRIINQLLVLSTFESSMRVRELSIKCLESVCLYPVFILLPYKQDVVLELIKCVDDKKRLVRNAAVKTRNKWFLIGVSEKSKYAH